MGDLSIAETRRGEVVVLAVDGSLNTQTAPRFEAKLLELLKAKQRLIVVDLSAVDYVASAALRVLLMVAKRLGAGGGQVGLCGLNPEVRKVFQISGFDRDFQISRTADEALASVAHGTEPARRPAAPSAPKPPPAVAAAPPPAPLATPAAPVPPPSAPELAPPDPLAALAGRLQAALGARSSEPAEPRPTVPDALLARVADAIGRRADG